MADLAKGTILENTYEIIEEIGFGGGGVIYKARHLRLQMDVVAKKIKDEVRGKVKTSQEANILKKLKHSYLPRIYDFIETEDDVFTVMDYIKGEDLGKAVKRHGAYSEKQVRKWAGQLGEALAYLHSQTPPIIHSDIKPANIMLTEEGDICLIDFNISLAMGGTMESAVGISAGFSPPEQYRDPELYARITHNYTVERLEKPTEKDSKRTETLRIQRSGEEKTEVLYNQESEKERTEILSSEGNGGEKYAQYIGKGIDTRSDIYSLGMTLCFLMTGEEPLADFERRRTIGEANVTISEGFALILDKMTALSPEWRYPDGNSFLKAVQNCYRLDSRYISMHRKQTGIQIGALLCLGLGILTICGGLYQIRREKNAAYYSCIQQAQEAMDWDDYEKAEKLLEGAKDISQTRIEAYREEIYLLYLNGDYEKCIQLGGNYINTTPFLMESEEEEEQFGDIHFIVGNAYFEMEDYANARIFMEHALDYNWTNGLYYRDYAIILAKLGAMEEAAKQLQTGVELGIAQDSIYMAQGEIAHARGEYEEAADYLNRTITITDDIQMKKRAILLCADVYKAMGNDGVGKEIELLEQNLGQFEGNGYLAMAEYLADGYVRKAQNDESQEAIYYEKALELFKSIYAKGYITYQLQENMAILYENIDDFEESEKVLFNMAERYPERYEVYKRLAYLEADRQQEKENVERDYGKVQTYFEKAKEMYTGKEQDLEMEMLEQMMKELEDGGWL